MMRYATIPNPHDADPYAVKDDARFQVQFTDKSILPGTMFLSSARKLCAEHKCCAELYDADTGSVRLGFVWELGQYELK